MNCLGCKRAISKSELLSCITCKACYHYQCLNFDPSYFKSNIQELYRSWRCHLCANVTRRNRDDNTPVGSPYRSNNIPVATTSSLTTSHLADMSCDESFSNTSSRSVESSDQCAQAVTQTVDQEATITMRQFSQLIDLKLNDIRATLSLEIHEKVKSEIKAVTDTMKQDFSQTTDFLSSEQTDLKRNLNQASQRILELEAQKASLQSDMAKLEGRLCQIEKSSRCCNLEVQCIPERRNENLLTLFKKLCEQIKSPLSESDIRSCRRVAKLNPSSDRPRNVLVTLPSERHRDAIISAVKRYNKGNPKDLLNSGHMGIAGDRKLIFVGEHLSKQCKDLHAAARRLAKEKCYKYTWVKFGRVYVRKDDTSPAIYIKDMLSLDKSVV